MFSISENWDFSALHECIVIGLVEKNNKWDGVLAELDQLFDGELMNLIKNGDISAKKNSISIIPTFRKIGAKRLVFVGLGKEKQLTFADLKEIFGEVFQKIKTSHWQEIAIVADTFIYADITASDIAHCVGEALPLSTYEFAGYKQKSNEPEKRIEQIVLYSTADEKDIKAALNVGYAYGMGTNRARELVNMPANLLTATDLAEHALKMADMYGFEAEILEKEDMIKLGMGALLAVNQGSVEPPKMIVLKYQGKEEWNDVIGLIGKGVTFDTGGYSIKTKDGIVGMKTDMGGAATVLGAMDIIGTLKPDQNVVAVIPSTDNMISGAAFKPDDVIVSMSGKTIEVLNTDAEGRLVLADALTYAKFHGANYLIDVATLTGGVIVALGSEVTGALTNNEVLYEQVLEASIESGEPIWRLPIFESHKKKIRNSKVADLNNSPTREGHAIMGGAFIGEFAEDTPWVHLDIAGTATTNAKHSLGPAGATGVMARTLAIMVECFEK